MYKILRAKKRNYYWLLFAALSLISACKNVYGQTYTKEPYLVQIGLERGKFTPDTSGIRKAFLKADQIRDTTGIIPVVEFAPGLYNLDSAIISTEGVDSVVISTIGAYFVSKHNDGLFTDDSTEADLVFITKPIIKNPNSEVVAYFKNAASSLKYLSAGGDSLDLQEALDRITELEDSSFQQIVFPDAQTIMFQNSSGTNVGAFLLDPDWLENDGETIFIKYPPPDFSTLDSTGGSLKVADSIAYVNNAVKSNDTIYFRNKQNDTLFIVIDSGTGGGINSVAEDASPALGGDLDLTDFNIINTTPTFTLTPTELSFVDGVTSAIQAQIDAKQPLDADLTTLASLTATTNNFIVSVSSAWASRTPAQVKTLLDLLFTYPDNKTISMAGDSFVMDDLTVNLNGSNEIQVHPNKVAKWDSVTQVAANAIDVNPEDGFTTGDMLWYNQGDTSYHSLDGDSLIGTKVTFENLNTNGDVGTGAAQVAAGNHTHTSTDITDLKLKTPQQLTTTTPTANCSTFVNWYQTLTGNTTITLAGIDDGDVVSFRIDNSGTNSFTVAFSWATGTIRWAGGTQPTQTTGQTDLYTFQRFGTDLYAAVIQDYNN